ncbi:MAG TPA: hypothetical protein PKW95_11980 [bacterium]|nr:hypothetical protein [bacterium]
MKRFFLLMLIVTAASGCASWSPLGVQWEPTIDRFGEDDPFIRPMSAGDYPIWGVRDGMVMGIAPARVGLGRDDVGGPRGLLRMGFEEDGALYFINFLAVAPVTMDGELGQSELDRSPSDKAPGIRIFAYPPEFHRDYDRWRDQEPPPWKEVARPGRDANGDPVMSLAVRCEEFPNGARPYFLVHFYPDRPREAMFVFYDEPGGKAMRYNVLSSTFGNLTRQRDVYLRGRVLNARTIWPHYRALGFAPIRFFPLDLLRKNADGDVVFAARPDEEKPWEAGGYPHRRVLTQYFRKPMGAYDDSLRGLVNGRFVYWKSSVEVHGGISFENVGLAQNYRRGDVLIYGYHKGDPEKLFR